MEQITKTIKQVAEQIERWFLLHERAERTDFTGSEAFTLFNLLPVERQDELTGEAGLRERQIPVLILSVGLYGYIICTTERFIHLQDDEVDTIDYSNFKRHK